MSARDFGVAAGAEHGARWKKTWEISPAPSPTIKPSGKSLNPIWFLCVAHRSRGWPWPSRLRKPGLLLAVSPRHSHLELRRTHLCRRPGREPSTGQEFATSSSLKCAGVGETNETPFIYQVNVVIFILAAKASCGRRQRAMEKSGAM